MICDIGGLIWKEDTSPPWGYTEEDYREWSRNIDAKEKEDLRRRGIPPINTPEYWAWVKKNQCK